MARAAGEGPLRALVALSGALSIAVALAIAAGCASTGSPRSVANAAPADAPLKMTGRFSMTHTETVPEDKRDGASGLFVVERSPRGLSLELSSPLGQAIARASHQVGHDAELRTQDGRVITAPTLDEVFERAIGIRVPAERLPDWLAGRFENVIERSPDGSRIRATDGGWRIDRNDNRWDIVRDEGPRRIEVRLIADVD
jgi:outer membrane biogenesis lipoprotein LolB